MELMDDFVYLGGGLFKWRISRKENVDIFLLTLK